MSRPVRILLIIVLTLVALSILSAGRGWELSHPRSSATGGVGYDLAMLAMIVITLAALHRGSGQQ